MTHATAFDVHLTHATVNELYVFSEYPHLKSSIPHPKQMSEEYIIVSRRTDRQLEYTTKIIAAQARNSDEFVLKSPVNRKMFQPKHKYLRYRKTRRSVMLPYSAPVRHRIAEINAHIRRCSDYDGSRRRQTETGQHCCEQEKPFRRDFAALAYDGDKGRME